MSSCLRSRGAKSRGQKVKVPPCVSYTHEPMNSLISSPS
uniref:Uncharacterized protein n=1 Tax=Anguilla anguilla TaxID=7936 RepID=A0A0E9VNZ3_ANGAN